MPLETAAFVADLVTANPVHTDPLSQTDSHLRLLKSVLKAQFPNFTSAALSSTNAQIDSVVSTVLTNGVAVLADAGAFFKTNTTDGFTNPSASEIDVKIAGIISAKFLSGGLTLPGSLTVGGVTGSTGGFQGPGIIPIGGTIVWWSDTLPSGSNGTWAFCNGQPFLRSNTALYSLIGTTFGVGDGVTTANYPDLRDNVPIGKGNMGIASPAGRITQYDTTTLGRLIGAALHTLSQAEIPIITPIANAVRSATIFGQSTVDHTGSGATTLALNAAGGVVEVDSDLFTPTLQPFGSGGSHDNVGPGIVCNWIIRTG